MPRQFSSVKVRVLERDWLICETTRAAREYEKNTKGEEKNCYLEFRMKEIFYNVFIKSVPQDTQKIFAAL